MTKNQIKYLKLLGYEDSQEDGAILQHPDIFFDVSYKTDMYVWKEDKFEDILKSFSRNLIVSTMRSSVSTLKNEAWDYAYKTRQKVKSSK